MIERAVRADHKYVESSGSPTNGAWSAATDAAHGLEVSQGWTPTSVEPFVINGAIGASKENIQPAGGPANDFRLGSTNAAHSFVVGEGWTP